MAAGTSALATVRLSDTCPAELWPLGAGACAVGIGEGGGSVGAAELTRVGHDVGTGDGAGIGTCLLYTSPSPRDS